ncbi:MAG: 3-dehydroquinate dehydratase [Desulfovibrionales bacterium]|jgi:3-dehydroquinate dehydratase-2|nr:3-dehydroquinate dehydratase [Desulfovibrionales bacterium]
MRILVVNGPNLRFVGQRQPDIYGSQGLDLVPEMVSQVLGEAAKNIALSFFQSNFEGALIDRLEEAWKEKTDGLVLNAGAYTHTSLALADCLAWIQVPCVEVHISNVFARDESIRHQSFMAHHCVGVIAGFGLMSYALAVQALWHHLS